MLDVHAVDELDLAIVNALQLRPRASWARIARVLSVDAATVARRWRRLVTEGMAWTTVYPADISGLQGAMVWIKAAPGRVSEVAASLAGHPSVLSLSYQSGDYDLLLLVVTRREISSYLLEQLADNPYVAHKSSYLVSRIRIEGSRWKVGALDPAQCRALRQGMTVHPRASDQTSPDDRAMLTALESDVRLGAPELAGRLGMSPAQARRRLGRLTATASVRFRCDIVRSVSGAPITMKTLARVSASRLTEVTIALARLRQIRSCTELIGQANLLIESFHSSLQSASAFEQTLIRQLPGIEIVDRTVTLRDVKWMGRLLDDDGLAVGHVPTPFWEVNSDHPRAQVDGSADAFRA
jgi:DNA-binding Lrp family transcriptional regulator